MMQDHDAASPDYSSLSLWLDRYPGSLDPRLSLSGDTETDVAIVGGGFTGLWTAYYLKKRDKNLRITVIERDICGFGASGRNGGWCVGELAASVEKYAKHGDHESSTRLLHSILETVDEVGSVVEQEGIACGFEKGGTIRWARNEAQAARQREEIVEHRSHGLTEQDVRLLDPDEARVVGNATDVRSGLFFAQSAALDPARLVRGLADTVEQMGVSIVERTAAADISPGAIATEHGTVRADVVVRATEAYTRDLTGERRTLVPIYSLMIATEPLSSETWDEIGLATRPTFADDRYMVIYGQRTDDDRIAFGGRGAPYMFGSNIDPVTENNAAAHDLIRSTLVELFPSLSGVEITHRWGGVLGVPRNWTPSVQFDPATGLAVAGGYVGEGVAASNLAGRTLADLITRTNSDLVDLPWVDVTWRKWEPEPLRWLGIRTGRRLMNSADRREFRTGKQSAVATRLSRLLR